MMVDDDDGFIHLLLKLGTQILLRIFCTPHSVGEVDAREGWWHCCCDTRYDTVYLHLVFPHILA